MTIPGFVTNSKTWPLKDSGETKVQKKARIEDSHVTSSGSSLLASKKTYPFLLKNLSFAQARAASGYSVSTTSGSGSLKLSEHRGLSYIGFIGIFFSRFFTLSRGTSTLPFPKWT
jgi:hypothetical protein